MLDLFIIQSSRLSSHKHDHRYSLFLCFVSPSISPYTIPATIANDPYATTYNSGVGPLWKSASMFSTIDNRTPSQFPLPAITNPTVGSTSNPYTNLSFL